MTTIKRYDRDDHDPGMHEDDNGDYVRWEDHEALLKRIFQDETDTDTAIRDAAKIIYPANVIDGDSYGVPPIEHITYLLVARILQLEGRSWPNGVDDDGAMHAARYWLGKATSDEGTSGGI